MTSDHYPYNEHRPFDPTSDHGALSTTACGDDNARKRDDDSSITPLSRATLAEHDSFYEANYPTVDEAHHTTDHVEPWLRNPVVMNADVKDSSGPYASSRHAFT